MRWWLWRMLANLFCVLVALATFFILLRNPDTQIAIKSQHFNLIPQFKSPKQAREVVYVRNCSCHDANHSQEYRVPNIVHYTWYAPEGTPVNFKHFLGVLSAKKVLNPDIIYIHTNVSSFPGSHWRRILGLSLVEVVNEGSPRELLGHKLEDPFFFSSDSNVGRLKYLLEYGGIYLDFDIIVVKSLDEFRKFECTLGKEQDDLLNTGLIICAKSSPFLYLWANSYLEDYRPQEWIYNTGRAATKLATRFPSLVHIEEHRFHRPNWKRTEIDQIWGNQTFNWREHYVVHTWHRFRKWSSHYKEVHKGVAPSEKNIMRMNNTYAEIARHILALGSRHL